MKNPFKVMTPDEIRLKTRCPWFDHTCSLWTEPPCPNRAYCTSRKVAHDEGSPREEWPP